MSRKWENIFVRGSCRDQSQRVILFLAVITVLLMLGAQCGAPAASETVVETVVVKETVIVEKEVVVTAEAPAAEPEPEPADLSAILGAQLNFIGWLGYEDAEAFKDFYDETEIVLNATYPSNLEEVSSLYKAGGPGSYDVGVGMNRYIMVMYEQGILEPLDESKLPNLKEMLPVFQDENWWGRIDGKLYVVPAFVGFDAICYRADLVPEPDWNFYQKEEYIGKYGMTNNPLGSMYLWAMTLGKSLDARTWTQDDLAEIKALGMEQFKNAKTIVNGEGETQDLLIRGDIILNNNCHEGIAARAREAGVDVVAVVPEGPVKMWADYYFIYKDSKNVEAAHAWINHAIGAEAMAHMTTAMGFAPPNEKAYSLIDPELAKKLGWPNVNELIENAPLSVLPAPDAKAPNVTVDEMYKAYDEIVVSSN